MSSERLKSALFVTAVMTSVLAYATPAEAKGTFFLLELNSGLSESAYVQGGAGLNYGASAGVTLRIPSTPLRWHLLGSATIRNARVTGSREGFSFQASRTDLDLFTANRVVWPVWRMVRVYGELGLGTRISSAVLERSQGLGSLTETQRRFLLVTALGVQARLTRHFSLGLRGEMTPVGGSADLAGLAAKLQPTTNRMSLQAQVGVHF